MREIESELNIKQVKEEFNLIFINKIVTRKKITIHVTNIQKMELNNHFCRYQYLAISADLCLTTTV